MDERFGPLPGFSAADFIPIEAKSGLRLPVSWKGGTTLDGVKQPIRLRVNWSGENQDKVRLFAIYFDHAVPASE